LFHPLTLKCSRESRVSKDVRRPLAFVLVAFNHHAPIREPDNFRVTVDSREITSTLKIFYDNAAIR